MRLVTGMTTLSRSADEQVSMVKSTTSAEMSNSQGGGSLAVDIGPGANPLAGVMATATAAGLLAAAAAQGAAPPVPAVPPPSSLSLLTKDPAVSHFSDYFVTEKGPCDGYARHLSLQSPITLDLSSKCEVMEDHSPGLRDDDDDDDDEADDKMDNQLHDPERLKAFNVSEARAVADPAAQPDRVVSFGGRCSFVCLSTRIWTARRPYRGSRVKKSRPSSTRVCVNSRNSANEPASASAPT